MKNKYILSCILVVIFNSLVFAQSYDDVNHKEVALNMTPLIWTLMPLNVNQLPLQPYNFRYRKMKNGRIFTFGLGAIFDFNADKFNVNLSLGKEKKRTIATKWNYYIGHNFVAGINKLNNSDDFFDREFETYIGYSNNYVIEYDITERISVYTQTSLFLGLSNSALFKVKLEAPIAIFFNVKI